MKPTTKIRFTEPQIALVMRAHPNCNLDHLSELSFEFNQAGKIIDCIGTIKDGGNVDHDYAGGGLARDVEVATPLHEFIYQCLLPQEMQARGKVKFPT